MIGFDAKVFFDAKAFNVPVKNAKKKIFREFGAYARTIAKNSIKTTADKTQHSAPGDIPLGHDGAKRYKDHIFYDASQDNVVIGAVLLPRNDQTTVPGVLEHGGQVQRTQKIGSVQTQTVSMQEARPHMQLAFDKAVEKILPKLIENSIVKE